MRWIPGGWPLHGCGLKMYAVGVEHSCPMVILSLLQLHRVVMTERLGGP